MKLKIETINGTEFYHYVSEYGEKIRCIETDKLYKDVYVPSDTNYTFEEFTDHEISDSEALRIITEGE